MLYIIFVKYTVLIRIVKEFIEERTDAMLIKVCSIIHYSEVPLYHFEMTALCLCHFCISIFSSLHTWVYGGVNGQLFVTEQQILGYTGYIKFPFPGISLLYANKISSQTLVSNISQWKRKKEKKKNHLRIPAWFLYTQFCNIKV